MEYKDTSTHVDYSNLIYKLNKKLSHRFNKLGYSTLYKYKLPEVYFADTVYINKEKMFFIKLGVELRDISKNNQIIKINDGLAFHFDDQIKVSLFSKNIPRYKFLELIKFFRYKFGTLKKKDKYTSYNYLKIISNAQADESCFEMDINKSILNTTTFDKVNSEVESASISSIAGDCFMSAVKQAWESTGGFVQDSAKGIWNFIKSPIKSASKAWSGAVNMVKTTTSFIKDFKSNLKSLKDVFNGISYEVISSLLCSVTGMLGGDHILKMLINPAVGLALLVPKVIKMINKISKSKNFIQALNRMNNLQTTSMKNIKNLIRNFLASSSQKFSKTLNTLSKYKFDKHLLEYGTCGI